LIHYLVLVEVWDDPRYYGPPSRPLMKYLSNYTLKFYISALDEAKARKIVHSLLDRHRKFRSKRASYRIREIRKLS